MKKRTWYIIGVSLLLVIVGAVCVWLNLNRHYDSNNPLDHIPSSAVAVFKINSLDRLNADIAAAEYNNDIRLATAPAALDSALTVTGRIFANCNMQEPGVANRQLIISFHKQPSDTAVSTLVGMKMNNYMEWMSIKKSLAEEFGNFVADTLDIFALTMPNTAAHFMGMTGGCLFIANNYALMARTLAATSGKMSLGADSCFCSVGRTASASASLSTFINIGSLDSVAVGQFAGRQIAHATQWLELDFEFDKKNIVANGFMASPKTSFAMSMAGGEPSGFRVDNNIPSSASIFISYAAGERGVACASFSDYLEKLSKTARYEAEIQNAGDKTGDDIEARLSQVFGGDLALFSYTGSFTDTANTCLVVRADNGTVAQALLNSTLGKLHNIETPRQTTVLMPTANVGIPVYEAFGQTDNLFFLDELFPMVPRKFYLRYENTLLFADNIETLKRSLYESLLNRTFGNDADFRNFRAGFPDDHLFFFFCNSAVMKDFMLKGRGRDLAGMERIRALNNFYGFGLQLSSLSNMPYVTAGLLHEPSRIQQPPTAWQNHLDTTIVGRPFAVRNHNTNEIEYIVQDAANNIHLINPNGISLWTRKIDGPIVGEITQIDYYNNNKLQYLFATAGSIHLIDRNGNNTAVFPIRLQNEAVSSVSYIDYGDPKNFRLFVACADKTIRLFDREGKSIQGWEMAGTEGLVRQPVAHYVSTNKDYLVMADEYRCYITDRRGNERVKLEPLAPNTNSNIYIVDANTPRAAFVTSTADGKMAMIDIATAKITTVDIAGIGPQHIFLQLAQADQFAFISAEQLVIVDKSGNVVAQHSLYLSSATEAHLTPGGDIAIWDADDSLGYVFKADGTIADGFPVPAFSPFVIVKQNKISNVVAFGRNNSLCCYIK